MAEIESTRYTSEKRDKSIKGAGRFNQPTQFHPQKFAEHMTGLEKKPNQK